DRADHHRPPPVLRRGRGEGLPPALPHHRQDRGCPPRYCPPGQAVLPARPRGQGRQGPREAVSENGAKKPPSNGGGGFCFSLFLWKISAGYLRGSQRRGVTKS